MCYLLATTENLTGEEKATNFMLPPLRSHRQQPPITPAKCPITAVHFLSDMLYHQPI